MLKNFLDKHLRKKNTNFSYKNLKKVSEEKIEFDSKIYDIVDIREDGHTTVKTTKRLLDNGDYFLFCEIDKPVEGVFEIEIGGIVDVYEFSDKYKKPDFDNRYGENKLTGPEIYIKTKTGTVIISKMHYYKELTKKYNADEESKVIELITESNDIILNKKLKYNIKDSAFKCSFFILFSKENLFKSKENLDVYLDFYYDGLKNNNAVNSFFVLPSGTYTKLPYSIEPFTKDGYGYSLHHSSKKELFVYGKQYGDRFYYNMMLNAIVQAKLYRKNEDNVFYTDYTSTWLKNQSGIYAPYIDTRLNETFYLQIQDFNELYKKDININKENYLNFLVNVSKNEKMVYCKGDGIFFPDYFKKDSTFLAHTSLNHQLGIMGLLRDKTSVNNQYKELYDKMFVFLEETYDQWVNAENGDLYYSLKEVEGEFVFSDKDYIYVTLLDLLIVQENYLKETGEINLKIDYLIKTKMKFLENNGYGIFDENAKLPAGESVNSRVDAVSRYNKIYS